MLFISLHGSKNKDNVSNFSFFRINEDNSLDISFEEWRDYLLFHPSSDLADIINHWRTHTVSIRYMNELHLETEISHFDLLGLFQNE